MTSLSSFAPCERSSTTRSKSLFTFTSFSISSLPISFFCRQFSLHSNFPSMASPPVSSFAAFFRSILYSDYWKSAKERGLKCNFKVIVSLNVDGEATHDRTASLCGLAFNACRTLQCDVHNHSLIVTTAVTSLQSTRPSSWMGEFLCLPLHLHILHTLLVLSQVSVGLVCTHVTTRH